MKLAGKIGLVTGAGHGIGKAIAMTFAREGAIVIVGDIDADAIDVTVHEINMLQQKTLPAPANVSDKEQVDYMIRNIITQCGRIDILVNCAGVQTETPFLELSEEEWDRIIDINLKGTFLCGQAVAREMVCQKHGTIINISSIHQFLPRSNIAHYAASKGGVMMLTKVMALELAQYGINVSCIAPGATATPMNETILNSPQQLAELNARIPLGRVANPSEVAQCAVYLASDDGAYVTGSTIYIDGGMNLGRLL